MKIENSKGVNRKGSKAREKHPHFKLPRSVIQLYDS